MSARRPGPRAWLAALSRSCLWGRNLSLVSQNRSGIYCKSCTEAIPKVSVRCAQMVLAWWSWSAVVSTDQHWSALVSSGQQWSALVSTDQHWSALVSSGQHWSAVVSSGQQWSALVSTRQQWSAVVSSGQQWSALVSTRQQWSAVVSTGQQKSTHPSTWHFSAHMRVACQCLSAWKASGRHRPAEGPLPVQKQPLPVHCMKSHRLHVHAAHVHSRESIEPAGVYDSRLMRGWCASACMGDCFAQPGAIPAPAAHS